MWSPKTELRACCLLLLLLAHIHVSDGATTHLKRATSCGSQFQCHSGLCIARSSTCDGRRDCDDGSDELPALCDKGDDRGSSNRPCLYPPIPENGTYSVVGCKSCAVVPGTPLQANALVLQYTCEPGYKLKGDYKDENILICQNGQWHKDTPTCEQVKCPRLTSESILADCYRGESRFTCDDLVAPGTKAVVQCKTYYTSASAMKQSLTCGLDGRWDDALIKCYPACGKDRLPINPLVSFGTRVKGGEFPWHIGIFKNIDGDYVNLCGGSLISLKYILSAAQCFWSFATNVKEPEYLFRVIAGKYHRNYTTKDEGQQERGVKEIDIHPLFRGSSGAFRDDIAVLTVDAPFELTESVRPVCVDWDEDYYVAPGDKGYVAGWGITEHGDPSENLLSAEFPVIEHNECRENIKPNYQIYFGSDKICAGYKNGTTVCNGDSGGGLTFIHELSPTGPSSKLYFVEGIVSLSAGANRIGHCNLKDYVAFTKVVRYKKFLARYREYY